MRHPQMPGNAHVAARQVQRFATRRETRGSLSPVVGFQRRDRQLDPPAGRGVPGLEAGRKVRMEDGNPTTGRLGVEPIFWLMRRPISVGMRFCLLPAGSDRSAPSVPSRLG